MAEIQGLCSSKYGLLFPTPFFIPVPVCKRALAQKGAKRQHAASVGIYETIPLAAASMRHNKSEKTSANKALLKIGVPAKGTGWNCHLGEMSQNLSFHVK